MRFPDGFTWGAATSAYQIEGSPLADGAGPSIWHRLSHTPGKIAGGDTGDVACDHYRRWKEDVALMGDLGLRAYRFSVAWPRVLPQGVGPVNAPGLDFYDRLVDGLCASGIVPYVTLYHWDLPEALQEKGGWASRAVVDWFADYAQVVFARLGDRVRHWMTLNEPLCIIGGYVSDEGAPGAGDLRAGLRAAHHLLLAHGRTVGAFRAGGFPGRIGIALNPVPHEAATDSEADRDACARAHGYDNLLWLDPLFRGTFPAVLGEWFGPAWPEAAAGDLAEIRGSVDFLGVNYYTRGVVAHEEGAGILHLRSVPQPGPHTAMGWEVHPESFHRLLCWIRDAYGEVPLVVTENGAAYEDRPAQDGTVADDDRVAYLDAHLRQVHRAIGDGVPVEGYFVWSLFDNFEWACGYGRRFGVVRVDFDTQERTVKKSGAWYRRVIAENGLPGGAASHAAARGQKKK